MVIAHLVSTLFIKVVLGKSRMPSSIPTSFMWCSSKPCNSSVHTKTAAKILGLSLRHPQKSRNPKLRNWENRHKSRKTITTWFHMISHNQRSQEITRTPRIRCDLCRSWSRCRDRDTRGFGLQQKSWWSNVLYVSIYIYDILVTWYVIHIPKFNDLQVMTILNECFCDIFSSSSATFMASGCPQSKIKRIVWSEKTTVTK